MYRARIKSDLDPREGVAALAFLLGWENREEEVVGSGEEKHDTCLPVHIMVCDQASPGNVNTRQHVRGELCYGNFNQMTTFSEWNIDGHGVEKI